MSIELTPTEKTILIAALRDAAGAVNVFAAQPEGAAEAALTHGATRDQAGQPLDPAEVGPAIERVLQAERATRDGLNKAGFVQGVVYAVLRLRGLDPRAYTVDWDPATETLTVLDGPMTNAPGHIQIGPTS